MKNPFALFGNIVHRLNNPLGAINLRLALLKNKRAELIEQDDYIREFVERTERDVEQALEIIKELKESLKVPQVIEPLSVEQAVATAFSGIQVPSTVTIVKEIDPDLPDVAARKNLSDVFRNLITNAIEAMPNGGELELRAEKRDLEKAVVITFSDSGRGIPNYMIELLFTPYFSTKGQSGHGIGLWWSKSYMNSIGGELELVSSVVGKGSVFKVTIPLAE